MLALFLKVGLFRRMILQGLDLGSVAIKDTGASVRNRHGAEEQRHEHKVCSSPYAVLLPDTLDDCGNPEGQDQKQWRENRTHQQHRADYEHDKRTDEIPSRM